MTNKVQKLPLSNSILQVLVPPQTFHINNVSYLENDKLQTLYQLQLTVLFAAL
jgi:hypothetical protein